MTEQMTKNSAPRRPRRMAREPGADNASATNSAAPPATAPSKQRTKASMVEELLASDDGATLDVMCVATGWLPHTCRAFLTGLRKKGKTIDRVKREDGTSVYRFGEPASDPHAGPASGAGEKAAA